MIHLLRHTAVRLWLSILVGTLTVLWLLPGISADIDRAWAVLSVLTSWVLTFLAVGWLFNRLALMLIERLFREGTIWERAGDFQQAEKIFRKAISVFDSFLISPFIRENKSKHFTTHLTRFYLARQDRGLSAEVFINTYLQTYPHEKTLAEEWLQQATRQNDLNDVQQELAYRIGEAQPENYNIQMLLARFYISTERTDYQALQCYRRILENDAALDPAMTTLLADLFYQERRTDAWTLKAYVKSYKGNPENSSLLRGVAACLHWANDDALSPDLLNEARELLSHVEVSDRKKMWQGFAPPSRPATPRARFRMNRLEMVRGMLTVFIRAMRAFSRSLADGLSALFKLSLNLYQRLIYYKHLKVILKWGGIGLAGAGFAILAVNTATFLVKSKPEVPVKEAPPVVVITDPFTLQVAAYIKKEHALRYVDELKALGLDAYWTEAKGIKTRWYQVRLSHFPDKTSARTYGESLKVKGIIDDFYVANYDRP